MDLIMETTPPESPTPDETAAEREETILALMSELGCSRESAEALAGCTAMWWKQMRSDHI